MSATFGSTTAAFARFRVGSRGSASRRDCTAHFSITAAVWRIISDETMTASDPPITIPQTDPGAAYFARRAEIDAAIAHVLEGGAYILGADVEGFEKRFADFIGVAHAIGVASGTDAIELALRACGIGAGDLVFTVSHTAVATVAAIERAGATAVLIDIEPGGFCMDPGALEQAVKAPPKGRPAAVLPVHLYGEPAALAEIDMIARAAG